MALDPSRLRPADLARLLNSTPLGAVIDEGAIHRHRVQAGGRVGDEKTVHLVRYVAWLFGRVQERVAKAVQPPPAPAPTASDYERIKEASAARNREASKRGRDIGPIPTVADPARREAARLDLRLFCDTYLSQVFTLPWSEDHLRVIQRAQDCVLRGGQFALAMPRGSGKTSLTEAAAEWAMLYGHRSFVTLIAAAEKLAQDLLGNIVAQIEDNDLIAADFPEVAVPIRALEGIANRCAGQTCKGKRTQITWTKSMVVLPTIEGSAASGAVVKVAGLTGAVRGMKFQRPDGRSVRPDLVIVDDPQTDESARSVSQCATRERILAGAVLGLAGPGQKIAALMPCTVIAVGDMADNILNRKKHPEWNGERTKLLNEIPESKLWDRYAEVRAASMEKHGDIRDATAFYREHRAELDEGAVAAWEARFNPDEASAVQHAMNLKLQDERAFWAEYQNEPLPEMASADTGLLTADQIAAKVSGIKQGVVPHGSTHLTAFIDVQQKALWWMVCAWGEKFSGAVVDYGAWPDQHREYFTLADAQVTLASVVKGAGLEGQIYAGLEQLVERLAGQDWVTDDGTPLRIGKLLIDASWGDSTNVVYQYARQSDHTAIVMPSHGRYVGPASKPFEEWTKKPGDRVGPGWRIPGNRGQRPVRHALYDTGAWKSFLHARLAVAMGDPGCLSLWGREPRRHRMLAEHLTSESRERMQGSSRVVDAWKLKPGRDNHLLDCAVGCCVAASMLGVRLPEQQPVKAKSKSRIRLSDLQGRRNR